MAKAAKKDKKDRDDETVNICRNRRAAHDYEILDRIECGLVLVGTEVKSLRDGLANLEELGDAREAARDVLRSGHLARRTAC